MSCVSFCAEVCVERERDERETGGRRVPGRNFPFFLSLTHDLPSCQPPRQDMVSRSIVLRKAHGQTIFSLSPSIYIPCPCKKRFPYRATISPSLPPLSLPVLRRNRLAPDGWAGCLRRMQNGYDRGPASLPGSGGSVYKLQCVYG